MRIVVVLPAPLGPRNPVTVPGSQRNVTSETMVRPPSCLVSASVWIMSTDSRPARPARVGIGVGAVALVILPACGASLAATFNAAIRARGRDLAIIAGRLSAWAFASPLLYPPAGSYWANAGACVLLTGVVLGW